MPVTKHSSMTAWQVLPSTYTPPRGLGRSAVEFLMNLEQRVPKFENFGKIKNSVLIQSVSLNSNSSLVNSLKILSLEFMRNA